MTMLAWIIAAGLGMAADWDPVKEADRVMAGLVTVTGREVKGAHDAEFVIAGGRAYIVAMANDVQPGENAEWAFVYCTLSVVDIKTMQVLKRVPMAKGGQVFKNATLPEGSCFVPRIIRKDARTVRAFFASEAPGKRPAQTYYLDFDVKRLEFTGVLRKARIRTRAGIFDMQPRRFYEDAVAAGFKREPRDFGLYTIDSFKEFDGKTYVAMNNYPGGQNGLAELNRKRDTFRVVGHVNPAGTEKLSESAVNRLPDGTWMAIIRQDGGTGNYMFSTSKDGVRWTAPAYRDLVPNGGSSKPNFEKFGGVYYLGWQESTRVNGVSRTVFNVDVSRDGAHWERKYRFATDKSFQYASFHQYEGKVYLTVTQGDSSPSRKERIMFGRLE
ncbi:MAG: exo-alpha-sialidase [Acidobacteria bacterium]|nr:exo-alpha-sialidase [Acidobacteriota bacterium]